MKTIPIITVVSRPQGRTPSSTQKASLGRSSIKQRQPAKQRRTRGQRAVIAPDMVSKNREVPRDRRARRGACSVPFPQKDRIKQKFIAGKNITQIAKEENRHWETISKIVKEADVLEHVRDLRARFYGALEEALHSAFEYIENSKDGGKLAYEMLKDAGVIPSISQRVEISSIPLPRKGCNRPPAAG